MFESAPTLAEATRDVADALTAHGALERRVQIISASGDGGAFAIGLRSLLHTIHRRARVTIIVLVNEIFANTGFQYSPATMPYADTSTTPAGARRPATRTRRSTTSIWRSPPARAWWRSCQPAHGKLFLKTIERSLACEGTAVIFVPAPCISGWKFEDGQTVRARDAGRAQRRVPGVHWERGKGGAVKDCALAAAERPSIEQFLAEQRRFAHLVTKDRETGSPKVKPGQEENVERLKTWVQGNVERMYGLAGLKS